MIIPEIKKILYATDLSENARYSFSYAVSIAHRYGAAITILHVMETPGGYTYDLSSYLGAGKLEENRKSHEEDTINTIKMRLDKFCEDVSGECPFNIDEIIVKQGNPAEEILLQTQAGDFDMVVMGTHGHGTFVDAMMGSTARKVFLGSKKPVLVVRLPEG